MFAFKFPPMSVLSQASHIHIADLPPGATHPPEVWRKSLSSVPSA